MHTQKFGASIRKLVDRAINAKKAKYECPKCHKLKVTRTSTAVWKCKSCDSKFAGGAYVFKTEAGDIATRLISEYSKS